MNWQRLGRGVARRVLRRRRFRQRGYLSRQHGFASFSAALIEKDVHHLFLHWPGAEVAWPEADDMILLLADEDMPKVESLLRQRPRRGDLACTVYTVGGLPGSDRNGVAFLPVGRARELLASADRQGTRLADDETRLLALCTEAVYHLGEAAGLPVTPNAASSPAGSPYGTAIRSLNARCNRWPEPLPLDLQALDTHLAEAGWRPFSDTLAKLARATPWLAVLIEEIHQNSRHEVVPGLAVFLVRERGLPYLDAFHDILERYGFDVLLEMPIQGAHQADVADRIRGGNWGRGPYPCSGGLPAHLLVAHDVHPDTRVATAQGATDIIDNARVFTVKERMRQLLNRDCPARQRCNPVHSSDNAAQAVEYLYEIADDRIAELLDMARQRNSAFRTPYPVLANLSKHARRAKVELIDFHGKQAICKTFRPGRERFLEREVAARELGADLPEVSRILEVGPRHLVFEWYDDRLPQILFPRTSLHPHGMLPLWAIERLRAVLLHYRRLGYECIDLRPRNLIYDPRHGLKIIDFEFLQLGQGAADTLQGNYAWYALPSHFTGDVPINTSCRPYLRDWLAYTGLPRLLCLHEIPRPLLVVVRSVLLVPLTLLSMARKGKHQFKQHYLARRLRGVKGQKA